MFRLDRYKHFLFFAVVPMLPVEAPPTIPPGNDIILYVNGGPGSRLEESADLVPRIHQQGQLKGKGYTVIGFDGPSEGYSSMVDHAELFPDDRNEFNLNPLSSRPMHYPMVAFREQFLVDLVDALDRVVPIKDRNIYVVGGSMGGCLALRLGHRTDEPWLRKIAAWSPACVWTTYGGDILKLIALVNGQGRWRNEPPGPGPESPGTRASYFDQAFGPATQWYQGGYTQPNPEEWYRGGRGEYPDWACKWDYIASARLDQQEVYNAVFRRWHWRLGTELLLFSFFNDGWKAGRDAGAAHRPPVYDAITVPTLLGAANDDDWDEGPFRHWENRWTNTNRLAPLLRNTPGHTAFFLDTGHSIHNERPLALADALTDFFAEPTAAAPLAVVPAYSPTEDEPCRLTLPRLPAIPPELLAQPRAARFLHQPSRQGGSFPDGKSAGYYGLRLKPLLRAVAARRDPLHALAVSTAFFYRGNRLWGHAAADLAVTGRASFQKFRALQPGESDSFLDEAREALRAQLGHNPDERRLRAAAHHALRRATQVVWALRDNDVKGRKALRARLGWIAVSGEDDPPHRPVNVSSAPYPQYDVTVVSHGHSFQVRTMIANPGEGDEEP